MMIVFRCYECVGRRALDGRQASKAASARARERDANNKLLEMYCIPFDACVFFCFFFVQQLHHPAAEQQRKQHRIYICIYGFDIHWLFALCCDISPSSSAKIDHTMRRLPFCRFVFYSAVFLSTRHECIALWYHYSDDSSYCVSV